MPTYMLPAGYTAKIDRDSHLLIGVTFVVVAKSLFH